MMQEPIKGGCLCGAIRYSVEFSDDSHSLAEPTTCQCTHCRKNSGALVAYFITAASSNVSWIGSTPKSYSATPGFVRTFCEQCGSRLAWVNTNEPEVCSSLREA
ncbi:Mss4-like protein [Mucidula mucida]|nr:Mss4-like protein [Mucidula mucida]